MLSNYYIYNCRLYSEAELKHHGILGMKWGVRRYQNKDGSLTPEGRARIKEVSKDRYETTYRPIQDSIRSAGIKRISGSDTDVIPKGTSIYRIANSAEPINERRKYVSVTDNDRLNYNEMWDMIGIDFTKPISEYTYSSSKDLKVATGKKVVEHIIDKYSNTKYKQLLDDLELAGYSYEPGVFDPNYRNPEDNWIHEFNEKGSDKIHDEVSHFMKYHGDKVVSDFKELGYDAIIDVEDMRIADYPVIILNPSESLKMERELTWEEKFGNNKN